MTVRNCDDFSQHRKMLRCKGKIGMTKFEFHIIRSGHLGEVWARDLEVKIFHILASLCCVACVAEVERFLIGCRCPMMCIRELWLLGQNPKSEVYGFGRRA